MSVFKCKMCGGDLVIEQGSSVAECEYCGSKQTLPKLDSERKANLYDRANHFRRNNEFDKAAGIYEQILNEDTTDAEAYWSLVLCRYGIEYVEDPATRKRVPTVNRAQFTSIFDDDNYKSALQYADGYQRAIYEEEASAINEIQKGILAISQKEEPFDIFICYKETDANGRRTPDSVLATDLYHQLTNEGFKVFFSRITLEDKLGTAYEPYIFAALNSAKVMVVLGTMPEHFKAVWVKNEWSRYLSLVKQSGGKKVLIPAYRDMDPYDLPDEFSHLQAQDMSKLGFMQDLIRGIKKIVRDSESKPAVKETTVVAAGSTNIAPLLKRAFMYLEDGEWQSADEYAEKVLDQDPENAEAYVAKLMAELKVCKQEDLRNQKEPFDYSNNFKKAVRFAESELRNMLRESVDHINSRNESERLEAAYNNAVAKMNQARKEDDYEQAIDLFKSIPGYRDSDEKMSECISRKETARKDDIFLNACNMVSEGDIESLYGAINLFSSIQGWKHADAKVQECRNMITAKEKLIRARKKKKTLIGIIAGILAIVCIIGTVMLVNNSLARKKEAILQSLQSTSFTGTYEWDFGSDGYNCYHVQYSDNRTVTFDAQETATIKHTYSNVRKNDLAKSNGYMSDVVNGGGTTTKDHYEIEVTIFGTSIIMTSESGYDSRGTINIGSDGQIESITIWDIELVANN